MYVCMYVYIYIGLRSLRRGNDASMLRGERHRGWILVATHASPVDPRVHRGGVSQIGRPAVTGGKLFCFFLNLKNPIYPTTLWKYTFNLGFIVTVLRFDSLEVTPQMTTISREFRCLPAICWVHKVWWKANLRIFDPHFIEFLQMIRLWLFKICTYHHKWFINIDL